MITFIYVALHVSLLITLLLSCRKIVTHRKCYWRYAIFPISFYGLEEGLRWGRETDWNFYYYVYEDYLHGISSNHEWLFQLLWRSFASFGLPYPYVITACSVFFIFALFFLFKPYASRKEFTYIIPLCVACHIITSSNLIRWYMAVSFMLIGCRLFSERKFRMAILCFVAAISTHFFSIVIVLFLLCLFYYKKIIMRPAWACLVCVLLLLLFDRSMLAKFGFIYDYLGMFNRFSGYLDNGYSWIIGADNGYSGTKSVLMSFVTFMPYFAFIISGHHLMQKGALQVVYYNLVVVASMLKIISSGLELFSRVYYFFDFFICLSCIMSVGYIRKTSGKFIYKLLLVLCVFYIVRKFLYMCEPMQYDELMLYVWDKQIEPSSLLEFKRLVSQ